ncbi:hypothetical protein [Bacillus toyonensis]|uniref:hypothetical protein n=1 Tax=Bacillus toyonensis TaxID=155322 RepID=UPI000BFCE0B1|nr:hypothetical protein [Bacillus toyonensis]PHD33041.1 hypothetical protein COF48_19135 [Bacillus toyonensis]
MFSFLVLIKESLSNEMLKDAEDIFKFKFELDFNNSFSAFSETYNMRITYKEDYLKFALFDEEQDAESIKVVQKYFVNCLNGYIRGVFIDRSLDVNKYIFLREIFDENMIIQ